MSQGISPRTKGQTRTIGITGQVSCDHKPIDLSIDLPIDLSVDFSTKVYIGNGFHYNVELRAQDQSLVSLL